MSVRVPLYVAAAADHVTAGAECTPFLLGVACNDCAASRWGVDVRGPLLPSAATAAYCSFLLEVAHDPQVCRQHKTGCRARSRSLLAGSACFCQPWARESVCSTVLPLCRGLCFLSHSTPHHTTTNHPLPPPPKKPHLSQQSSVAEVLAAMIPCSRLYGFLGCRLAAATSHLGRHAYSEWVDTYSSEAYLVWCLCVPAGLLQPA